MRGTPDIQGRRRAEDEALKLGSRRRKLERRLATNTRAITAFLPNALAAGVSLDGYAKLVGVSRQTLYRWQEIASRPDSGAGREMLKQDARPSDENAADG